MKVKRIASSPGRRENGGFTLIELLVTIAIVAILTAISVSTGGSRALIISIEPIDSIMDMIASVDFQGRVQ